MAGLGAFLAGGVLQGAGQGIVAEGKAKRERALQQLQHRQSMDRMDAEYRNRRGLLREESDLRMARESEQITSTFTDDQGRVIGVTRSGDTKPLGTAQQDPKDPKLYTIYDDKGRERKATYDSDRGFVPVGGSKAADSDAKDPTRGISAEDNRLLDRLIERHTTTDDFGEDKTDWGAVSRELDRMGRDDLARIAGPSTDGGGLSWEDAMSRATSEAEEREGGWFSSGDFGGVSKQEWITERARELSGRGGNAGREVIDTPPQGRDQATAGEGPDGQRSNAMTPKSKRGEGDEASKPQGSGTAEDPYTATTQAQVDWFKKNAKSGDRIVVDGTVYTKP